MATHSSVLAWRIPGMGEPGGLPSLGSHRVGHAWSDLAAAAAAADSPYFHIKMVILYLLCIRLYTDLSNQGKSKTRIPTLVLAWLTTFCPIFGPFIYFYFCLIIVFFVEKEILINHNVVGWDRVVERALHQKQRDLASNVFLLASGQVIFSLPCSYLTMIEFD